MKRIAMIGSTSLVMTFSACLGSGCAGLEPASGTPTGAAETAKVDSATSQVNPGAGLIPGAGDPNSAASSLPGNLTAAELSLLQSVLSQVGTSTGALNDPNAATSLGQLAGHGLHRRDIALAALDVLAQQANLPPQEQFMLDLAQAYFTHDTGSLMRLMLESLGGSASSSATTTAASGATTTGK